jgi:aromatic ring-opening dioxygenase catalytic subunit (LigB family)
MTSHMPVIFAAHGAPILLDDPLWVAELAAWAAAMPRPKAVLMLSAHWERRPLAIGATLPTALVYDFHGFPDRYYQTRYPSPGAPQLAQRVRELLDEKAIAWVDEPSRGLDHGAYVPLVAMYPAADVPVLQISLPRLDPAELYALGEALAPLRSEGVADSTFKPPALAVLAAECCLNSPLPAPAAAPDLLLLSRLATVAATESPALRRATPSGTNRPEPAAGARGS